MGDSLKVFSPVGNARDKYLGFRNSFDEEFDKLAENLFPGLSTINKYYDSSIFTPNIEVSEDENSLTVKVEVPGVKEDEIDIQIKDNSLVISGEKKVENKNNKQSEFFYGQFSRSIYLGDGYNKDTIDATSENGILTITIEKNKIVENTKKIIVKKK